MSNDNNSRLLEIEYFVRTLYNLRNNPLEKNEFIRKTLEIEENKFLVSDKYKDLIESRTNYYKFHSNISFLSLSSGKLSQFIRSEKQKVIYNLFI